MTKGSRSTAEWRELARQAELRTSKMASLCSVSVRQLQRIFRQQLNCTPREWLRVLRCQLAKDLITKGCSTKTVAKDLFFSNGSHLCREFRRVFGASPQYFAPNRLSTLRLAVLATRFESSNLSANGRNPPPETEH